MWDLIPRKLMPPTRLVRYCCEVLKETAGRDRWIITGVRWTESVSRKANRGIYEANSRKASSRVILNNDNDDLRLVTETCSRKNKRTINPIIDWTDEDVWSLLHDRHVQCNPLYCDFGRVGCVGCPMAGKAGREREFLRWPRYKRLYLDAFARMLMERQRRDKPTVWQDAMDVYRWWMEYDVLPGQMDILEVDYGEG